MSSPSAPAASPPLRVFSWLATKLLLAQLAPVALSFFIFNRVAQLGPLSFSAYAQVTLVNLTAYTALVGVLTALYPLAGRQKGAQDHAAYARTIAAGLLLAALLALPLVALNLLDGAIAAAAGQPAALGALAQKIAYVALTGAPPSLLLAVCHVHFTLSGRAGAMALIYALGLGAGVLLAWPMAALAPGQPERQLLLIAAAVALSNWLMLGLCAWRLRAAPELALGWPAWGAALAGARRIAATGWPIGCVIFLESAILMASGLAAGALGVDSSEVHMACLQWLNVGVVLPVAIGQAGSQSIALLDGQGQRRARNLACWQALGLAAATAAAAALALALWPLPISALLLGPRVWQDPALGAALRWMMPLVGLLLVFESLIIVGAAALRGIGVVRATFALAAGGSALTTAALWLGGPGLGYGLPGIWAGLLFGFGLTAAVVLLRCHLEFRPRPAAVLGVVGRA